eukprot:202438_1
MTTNGATHIELEHTIGMNVSCCNPVHYLYTKANIENESNLNSKPKEEEEERESADYLLICGSSIVLSSFSNPQYQSFLRGHTSSIECCAVSPNKHFIAVSQGGPSPDVYVWDWRSNRVEYRLEEHNQSVQCMAFSDDSRFLSTVGHKMYIWDMQSGYIVTSSMMKASPCADIVWGGRVKDIKKRPTTDYLFATCGVEQVRIWAMTPSTGKLLSEKCDTSKLHSRRTFTCLAFSDSADLLIAGTESGDFFVFDVRRLSVITSYQSNCVGGIRSMICCPLQGTQYIHDPLTKHFFIQIIVGFGDGSIAIWKYNDDLEKFIEENKIIIHDNGGVKCMDINEDKSKLLVATSKGNIHQIDLDSTGNKSKAKQRISCNATSSIVDVQFPSDSSDSFVTVSSNGCLRKWSMNDYSILLAHDDSKSGVATCFDFNDEVIITGWMDGAVRSYNANKSNDGVLWNIRDAHSGGVSSLRLGYNEKYIISAGCDGTLRIWDIRFKKLVTHLKEHTAAINAIELYSDSRHALTCSADRSFICWDFATQKRISCHRQNMGAINDIKLTANEDIVITVGGDRSITLWDIRQTKAINSVKNAHGADINCVQISSSNKMIATADTQSTVKLWDLNAANQLNPIPIAQQTAYCGKINGLAFSNDEK